MACLQQAGMLHSVGGAAHVLHNLVCLAALTQPYMQAGNRMLMLHSTEATRRDLCHQIDLHVFSQGCCFADSRQGSWRAFQQAVLGSRLHQHLAHLTALDELHLQVRSEGHVQRPSCSSMWPCWSALGCSMPSGASRCFVLPECAGASRIDKTCSL